LASKARGKTSAIISPIAFAAVQKFDAVFAAERAINGSSPAERVAIRRKEIAPLVDDLIEWMKRASGSTTPTTGGPWLSLTMGWTVFES
jgi:hypothetical protein